MPDLDFHDVRRHVDQAAQMPGFDQLVVRASRRRRRWAGTAVAAVMVLVGAGALAFSQPGSDANSLEPVGDGRSTDVTAVQIVDDPESVLAEFVMTPSGVAYTQWSPAGCGGAGCPSALAWSDDGWQSRTTELIPAGAEWSASGDTVAVVPPGQTGFLLDSDGERIDLQPRRRAPATGNELAFSDFVDSSWSLVDPQTADVRPLLAPGEFIVHELVVLPSGDLRAVGETDAGTRAIASSEDGGQSWSQQPLPDRVRRLGVPEPDACARGREHNPDT